MSQTPASGGGDPVKPTRGHKKAGSGGSGGGGGAHGSSTSGGGVGGIHRSSVGPKSKDSSALLMSVIRSLSASSDDHQQREQEKAKLDKVGRTMDVGIKNCQKGFCFVGGWRRIRFEKWLIAEYIGLMIRLPRPTPNRTNDSGSWFLRTTAI